MGFKEGQGLGEDTQGGLGGDLEGSGSNRKCQVRAERIDGGSNQLPRAFDKNLGEGWEASRTSSQPAVYLWPQEQPWMPAG